MEMVARQSFRLERRSGDAQIVSLLGSLGFDFRQRKQFQTKDARLYAHSSDGYLRSGRCASFWTREEENLPYILQDARERYLRFVKELHPDTGGDAEKMTALNVAWDRIEYLFGKHGIRRE